MNLAAGHVSIKYGAKGPNEATATACTTSAHSIGDAYRIIQRGDADAMIAGGTEATITPLCVGGFASMKALSTRNEEPMRASRPWDKDRDGFVIGEGAGILILEELDFAKARGANILGEVVGYGLSSDAFHMTGMAPEGEGCARSMRNALKSAGLQPEEIDYVNAHRHIDSTGRRDGIQGHGTIFGEHALSHKLLVSSTKSMTGHLLGGAGGLEGRHYADGNAAQHCSAHDQPRQCRSRVPPELRAAQTGRQRGPLRPVEFLRLRRDQRFADLQALGRVVKAHCS